MTALLRTNYHGGGACGRAAALVATLAAALVVLGSGAAWAQGPQVQVNVEPRTVEAHGTVVYTLDVVTEGNLDIHLGRDPNFGPMHMMGRMAAPQFVVINGQARRQLTVTYTLRVPGPGNYTIEPPVVVVGDARYTPASLNVRVVEPGQLPARRAPRDQNVFVDVTVEPAERAPYVGEQVTIAYDLMVDTRQARVRPRPPSEPALDAFWVEDLSDQTSGRRTMVNQGGRILEKTPLRTVAAFPLRPGPATVDSIVAPVVRGGFFGPNTEQNVTSEAIELDVQPLPPGAPDGFHEANVGDWSLEATLDATHTRVGAPVTLTLTARGKGRASRLRLPSLPAIAGLRVLDRTSESRREARGLAIHGTRHERIVLMPEVEGRIGIPALTFSIFDPDSESYRTVHTRPFTLEVEPGELPPEPQADTPLVERTSRQATDVVATLVARLHPPLDAADAAEPSPHPSPVWWVLGAVPLVGIAGLLVAAPLVRRRRSPRRDARRERKQAMALVRAELERAREAAPGGAAAYDHLLAAIRLFATRALGIAPGAVTERELGARLGALGVSDESADALVQILRTCSAVRYAPGGARSAAQVADDIDRAARCIDQIARQVPAARTASGAATVASVLVAAGLAAAAAALLAGAPAVAHAEQAAEPSAEAAIAQAKQYRELADAQPRNARANYNAGTALAQAGEFAPARLYLERAALQAPGDARIGDNLELVRQIVGHRSNTSHGSEYVEALGTWKALGALSPGLLYGPCVLGLWLLFAGLLMRRNFFRGDDWRHGAWLRPLGAAAIATAALCLLASAGLLVARGAATRSVEPAIVVAPAPVLREGPSTYAAPPRTRVRPVAGMLVEVVERRKNWVKVEIADGVQGWMPAADIADLVVE